MNLLKIMLLSLVTVGVVSCQSLGKPKRLVEFEIKSPKGTEPHGVCFSEYKGNDIVICCFWERSSVNLKCIQAYDLKGRPLQIPQEELDKCVEDLLEGVRFNRRFSLETRELGIPIVERSLALLDKCIDEDGECCAPIHTRRKLTLANAMWKVPVSHYTNWAKAVDKPSDNDMYSTFDFNHLTLSPRSHDIFFPVFTAAKVSFRPFQFHVWGISGLDGKELAYYCSSKIRNGQNDDFMPSRAFMDSALKHIVVKGFIKEDTSKESMCFYDSPEKFVNGHLDFRFDVPGRFNIEYFESFFLSPDIFCFSIETGGCFTQNCRILLYCFSENRIIVNEKLNNFQSNPCGVWYQPWCDVSKDNRYLVVGFERTFGPKTLSSTFQEDDFQNWVRIYQLIP